MEKLKNNDDEMTGKLPEFGDNIEAINFLIDKIKMRMTEIIHEIDDKKEKGLNAEDDEQYLENLKQQEEDANKLKEKIERSSGLGGHA